MVPHDHFVDVPSGMTQSNPQFQYMGIQPPTIMLIFWGNCRNWWELAIRVMKRSPYLVTICMTILSLFVSPNKGRRQNKLGKSSQADRFYKGQKWLKMFTNRSSQAGRFFPVFFTPSLRWSFWGTTKICEKFSDQNSKKSLRMQKYVTDFSGYQCASPNFTKMSP